MTIYDKIKAQASKAAQMAQDATAAGQAKLDQVQMKRQLDALYRDLGAAVYADRTQSATSDAEVQIERIIGEITAQLAKLAHDGEGDDGAEDAAADGSGPATGDSPG